MTRFVPESSICCSTIQTQCRKYDIIKRHQNHWNTRKFNKDDTNRSLARSFSYPCSSSSFRCTLSLRALTVSVSSSHVRWRSSARRMRSSGGRFRSDLMPPTRSISKLLAIPRSSERYFNKIVSHYTKYIVTAKGLPM